MESQSQTLSDRPDDRTTAARTTPPPDPAAPGGSPGWLHARDAAQATLHAAARQVARRHFGPRVFVRAVLEVSNFCRQNCTYCGMRRDNRPLARFRLGDWQALRAHVEEHCPPEVTDLNIQAGEDPVAVRRIVLPLVRALRERGERGVSVCLGTLTQRDYDALREAGADYFIIKLETGDAAHYRQLQAPGGDLEERLAAIRRLAASGWRVSSGCIAGLPGQSDQMLWATLQLLRRLPLAGVSVSPFIPGEQTPLAGRPAAGLELTLNALATLRLQNPAHVIPAVSALNSVGAPGAQGYARALAAGANLVTINLTPEQARPGYVIYQNQRYVMTAERVRAAVAAAGLECSREGLVAFLRRREAAAGGTPAPAPAPTPVLPPFRHPVSISPT